jgi:hypothetical protein
MLILLLIILFIFLFSNNEGFNDCVDASENCENDNCTCCSGVKPSCTQDIKGKKTCMCQI